MARAIAPPCPMVFNLTCDEILADTCFPSIRMLVRLEVILATSRSTAYDAGSTNTMALARIESEDCWLLGRLKRH